MTKRSMLTFGALAGTLALAACAGGDGADEVGDDPGFETTDPYATDPAATTAPPAEMEMDSMGMGMDTMGRGMMETDTAAGG